MTRSDGPDHPPDPEADPAGLYQNAACGLLSTLPDGTITTVNATLLTWVGRGRDDLVGRHSFSDLLTVGGRIHHETHFAPLLRMQGAVGGMALELRTPTGRLPVLVSSTMEYDAQDRPTRIHVAVFEASDRRTYERELLDARRAADVERDRVQRLASTLQRTLLPPQLPRIRGIDAAAYYHPASVDEVGGDFYDLFRLADGRWGLFLGDVCGKGADAAALTSLARYTLRSAAAANPDPVTVLHNLDAVLTQEHDHLHPAFCTVIFGVLTPGSGSASITLAGGGHPAPLLLRSTGSAEFVDLDGGQLVGAVARPIFVRATVDLTPGDTLLLYTDGVIEARIDEARNRYDEAGLLRFASTLAPATAPDAITATAALLAGFGDGLDDDTALLAIGAPGRAPGPAARRPG
ncbi:MAG: SpoIIE family protein phosphatase [Pseudonocardia sp.]|nr:SpoIIE family protein phosphatase [Pseudonocardia sp.]